MTEPIAGGDLLAWLRSVARSYRWGGRQGIDLIEPGLEAEVLVATFAEAIADPQARVHDRRSGEVRAVTARTPKPMETEAFGIATATLSPIVAPVGLPGRSEVVREVLDDALAAAADDGVEVLILRVDADDTETLVQAQVAGFTVHEATTTWLADSARDAPAHVAPSGVEVLEHEGDLSGALTTDEIDRLVTATAAWDQNHFRADPLLPSEAVDRFYGRWVHNIASGRWCDRLFVAREDGRLLGIFSEHADRPLLAATGVELRIGEWLVVVEGGRGGGRALLAAAGRQCSDRVRYHSWETQLRNSACLRCMEGSGVAHPIRGAYTLHAWPRTR